MVRSTIAFIGQCHTSGYPGVPPEATFPRVCRQAIQSCRPGVQLDVLLEQYQHPAELPGAVAKALRARTRIVVIEVIGWLAIKGTGAVDLSRLPKGLRTAYERVRHFRHVSHLIASKLHAADVVARVQATGYQVASGVLKSIVHRYPRPSVAEYEQFVDEAARRIGEQEGVYAVIQGPGSPNLDLDARWLAPDATEKYRAVEAMARRVAAAREALYVDRWDTIGSGFFLERSIRPRAAGHSVWGSLLARELLAAGLV